ncbi:MAG: AMP-binding protein, partial [Chlamydiia bacterium]|nr:AMP-binding protein [Chlamydiia bacterium]
GGTTGKAKGVMLTHNNICSNALPVIGNMHYGPHTRYLHAAPMFHAADCGSTFGITQSAGAHLFLEKFHPETLLKQLQDDKISAVMLVPTMLNMMVNHPNFEDFDLSSLTDIIYGASPMPEPLIRTLLQAMPHTRFTQCLGMTEMSPVITCLYPHQHKLEGPDSKRLRSVGQAAFNVEVRIVDEADQDLPPNQIGQILCRGTPMMKGYWNQPDQTSKALKDGWLHTGDAGYMDEDGFIYVVDRVKDMIITGGENVYSTEVESCLLSHKGVKDCAVIGLPHDVWGEVVTAIVVPHEGSSLTEELLVTHCRSHIAHYKCPSVVIFRDVPLPLSGAAKVLKMQLRAEYSDSNCSITR